MIFILLELGSDLRMRSRVNPACARRFFIFEHQGPRMRLPILCLPPVEIALFFVMLEKLSLLFCLALHFAGQRLEMRRQCLVILAASSTFDGLTQGRAVERFVSAHGSAGSQEAEYE